MDDALGVGELQAPARLHGHIYDLVQRDTMVRCVLDNAFDVATAHQLADHVGLAVMVSQVEDGDDVGVRAEASHGLGFSGDTGAARIVQTFGLDKAEGYVPVEERVMGQKDPLLTTLAKELLDPVAAAGEGGRLVDCR